MTTESYNVVFSTTKGDFTVCVYPAWAPKGAGRFRELVESDFFTDIAFFRVLQGFVAQFGISGDPSISAKWRGQAISDDPVVQSNTAGRLSFATAGPGTRTSQLFVNLANNARLDGMGFAPFAEVTDGVQIVDLLHSGYGEGAPYGKGPDQSRIESEGNAYLRAEFPDLDYIEAVSLEP
jgi:peptidyl-prolyl cis-trans isomerase A (cyclophilin A)